MNAAASSVSPSAEEARLRAPEVASAIEVGLVACHRCALVCDGPSPGDDADEVARCPRCRAHLWPRQPRSIEHTAAYLIAATLMYVPANVLPVMTTESVAFGRQPHTLLGGIGELWSSGSWELAAIVFVASIAVPILKIVALTLLAATAARRSRWRQRERARLHRLLETIGHWSMLDVFVVVLLVGMIRFGAFASVRPEGGLLAFGAVVVLTMLAASSFDPRLIWPADDGRRQ